MNKKSVSIVLFLTCASFCSAQEFVIDILSKPAEGLNIIYDPSTGQLALEANVPGQRVTTLEMKSASQKFTGDRPAVYSGIFDLYTPPKAFVLDAAGKDYVDDLGNIGPGLTGQEILDDIAIDGAKFLGGGLDSFQGGVHLIVVPEPSSLVVLGIGLLGLFNMRRHKS